MDLLRPSGQPARWNTPFGIFMVLAGLVGGYYLLTEHLNHVSQAIPYLFLLACPLMHLFHGHHHGGHGTHSHQHPAGDPARDNTEAR
jgi:hypothetical protein